LNTFDAAQVNHTSTFTTLKSDTQVPPYVARCLQLKFLVCLLWWRLASQLGLLMNCTRMVSLLIFSYKASRLLPDMFTSFVNDIWSPVLNNC